MVHQHVEGRAFDHHHRRNRPDGGRVVQHAANGVGRGRVDQVAAFGGHGRVQALLFQLQPAQVGFVAGAQIGVERLVVQRVGRVGAVQHGAGGGKGSLAVQHGQSLFGLGQFTGDIGLEGVELGGKAVPARFSVPVGASGIGRSGWPAAWGAGSVMGLSYDNRGISGPGANLACRPKTG